MTSLSHPLLSPGWFCVSTRAPCPPPGHPRSAQPGPPEPEWVWLSADTRASCPQWGPGVTSARVHTRGLGVRLVTWHDASGGVKSKNPQVQSRQSEEKASLQWVQRNAMSASECIARECGVCNAATAAVRGLQTLQRLVTFTTPEWERELVVLRCSFYRSRCCGARCRLQARHHVIIWAPRVIEPFWSQLSRA